MCDLGIFSKKPPIFFIANVLQNDFYVCFARDPHSN